MRESVVAAIACSNPLMDSKADVYGKLELLAQKLEAGQKELFAKYGIPVVINRVGSASCVFLAKLNLPMGGRFWSITMPGLMRNTVAL